MSECFPMSADYAMVAVQAGESCRITHQCHVVLLRPRHNLTCTCELGKLTIVIGQQVHFCRTLAGDKGLPSRDPASADWFAIFWAAVRRLQCSTGFVVDLTHKPAVGSAASLPLSVASASSWVGGFQLLSASTSGRFAGAEHSLGLLSGLLSKNCQDVSCSEPWRAR